MPVPTIDNHGVVQALSRARDDGDEYYFLAVHGKNTADEAGFRRTLDAFLRANNDPEWSKLSEGSVTYMGHFRPPNEPQASQYRLRLVSGLRGAHPQCRVAALLSLCIGYDPETLEAMGLLAEGPPAVVANDLNA